MPENASLHHEEDDISIPDDSDSDLESLSSEELSAEALRHDQYSADNTERSSRAAQAAKAIEVAEERSLPPSTPTSPVPWSGPHIPSALHPSNAQTTVPEAFAPPLDYLAALASHPVPVPTERTWDEDVELQSTSDSALISAQYRRPAESTGRSPERLLASQLWNLLTEYMQQVQQRRDKNFTLNKKFRRLSGRGRDAGPHPD